MAQLYYIVPVIQHNVLVEKAYLFRGYKQDEAEDAVSFSQLAATHGIRTHNAIKALHLDHLFGSTKGGCWPGAEIEVLESKFKAVQVWDANYKLGQSVAIRAMETCMKLADEYGVGVVAVDNCFHYLWGGGYVMNAAKKGYLAYTCCTSMLAEVVPFGGKTATLGTNPHSWGFPTQDAIGFPIVIDWATSTVAMGRVQQLAREGKQLPPGSAVDANGEQTTDPKKVAALLPFGGHKGYGLALIDELYAAYCGGSLPTLRGKLAVDGDKHATSFYFQVIHPDAIAGNDFAKGRNQTQNVKAVIENILGPGNENCLLPGQPEAEAAKLTEKHGGLLFTKAEIDAFNEIAEECGERPWDAALFKQVEI